MKRFRSIFCFACKTIFSNCGKLFLASSGVILGIIALSVTMSIYLSMIDTAEHQMMVSGANTMLFTSQLVDADTTVDILTQVIPNIKKAIKFNERTMMVYLDGSRKKIKVIFTDNDYFDNEFIYRYEGNAIINSSGNDGLMAVINDNLAMLLKGKKHYGKTVNIEGISYSIEGVVNDARNRNGFVCYVHYDMLSKYDASDLSDNWLLVSSLVDFQELKDTVGQIQRYLNSRYYERIQPITSSLEGTTDQGLNVSSIYSLTSMLDMFEQYKENIESNIIIMTICCIVLIIIGGVGIGNVFNILSGERSNEIGVAKAMGATKTMILMQFLFETLIISFIAVTFGAALGILLAFLSNYILPITIAISWKWVLLSVSFSALLSIVSGIRPAIRCAKLDPIRSIIL